jgi:hypothetical protein
VLAVQDDGERVSGEGLPVHGEDVHNVVAQALVAGKNVLVLTSGTTRTVGVVASGRRTRRNFTHGLRRYGRAGPPRCGGSLAT